MYPRIQADLFEKWLPPRGTLQVALGIWLAGFVVAGATAWRMHHQTARTQETKATAAEVAATPTDVASDTAESQNTVFMPIDVVRGLRTPKIGVALRQKP
jgi:hypothetical protein